MLKNAYLLAKIGADTAENDRHFVKNWQLITLRVRYPTDAKPPTADEQALRAAAQAEAEVAYMDAVTVFGVLLACWQFFLCKILQLFSGLVLGCIKTKFCKKICVRQYFSSSTRFASFRTAANSKF